MAEAQPLELSERRTLTYRACAALVSGLSRLLFRPTVIGAENIPLEGPVLIAPIHRSNVDFALTLFISKRKAFFMAKDSLFRVPLLGPLITHLGAFPIRRGSADRESMAHSEAVLRQGHALVLFPEGTRQDHHRRRYADRPAVVRRSGVSQGAHGQERRVAGGVGKGVPREPARLTRRRRRDHWSLRERHVAIDAT